MLTYVRGETKKNPQRLLGNVHFARTNKPSTRTHEAEDPQNEPAWRRIVLILDFWPCVLVNLSYQQWFWQTTEAVFEERDGGGWQVMLLAKEACFVHTQSRKEGMLQRLGRASSSSF